MKRKLASTLLLSWLCYASAYAQQSSSGPQADQVISQAQTMSNLTSLLSRFNSLPEPLSNVAAALALSQLALRNSGQAPEVPAVITRDAQVPAPVYLPATVTGTDVAKKLSPADLIQVYLPDSETGTDLSMGDVEESPTLQPGTRFAGNITGGPLGGNVIAQATDGSFSTISSFSPPPNNRLRGVATRATFNMNFCYLSSPGGPTVTFVAPVLDLTPGDVLNYDQTLPGTMASLVTGTISGVSSPFAVVLFSSTDGTTSGFAAVGPGGQYSLGLPDGTYSVWLTQFYIGMSSSMVLLGTVTVSGPTTFNSTAPPTGNVTVTVTMADGSPLQANSVGVAIDVTATGGSPGSCAQQGFASGFSLINPSGGFVLNLATGVTYNLEVLQPLGSNSTVLYLNPETVTPTTTVSVIIPAFAGMANIFGTVNAGAVGVPNVGISNVMVQAFTMQVVASPNVSFFGSTTTGMDGSYILPVFQGTAYTENYIPPVPTDF